MRQPAVARLYKNNERLLIGAATLLVFLLAWEALAESGFIDPLFISSPIRVVLAGWGLVHDPDFWNDAAVSATEFSLAMAPPQLLRFRSGLRSACPSACNICSGRSPMGSMPCRASPCCRS
jgi:ABC-type nitrate/sulfonate/bicarbonate transport system permease component